MAHNLSLMGFGKRLLLKPLGIPGVAETVAELTRTQATVFMCHRFSAPEEGVVGHDPTALRRVLAHLRRRRYSLLSLEELLRNLQAGQSLKRSVAFTVDDGYFDHGRIAGPVFAEFDCPVTVFLASGFLDGITWFWWDRLTYIIESAKRSELHASLGGTQVVYQLESAEARAFADRDLNRRCQDATEAERLRCILDLSREAEVDLPAAPPARFRPLSWDEARRLEKGGMTFGPHTVTHPVLSSTTDEQAEFEITESWRRLRSEVERPVPVFCYPAGRRRDFGEREIRILRGLGLLGAVAGEPGIIRPVGIGEPPDGLFKVPRFGYQDSLSDVLQCLSGLEMLKARIRGAVA